jgi:regulator of replication initiation timing
MITPITFVLLCLAFLAQRWEWRRAKKRAEHWERSYKSVRDSLLKRAEEVIEAKEAHSGLRQRFDVLCQENIKLRVEWKEQMEKFENAKTNVEHQAPISQRLESEILELRRIINTLIYSYQAIK